MTKILIKGANEFLGKGLIVDLFNQSYEICAFCRTKAVKVFTGEMN